MHVFVGSIWEGLCSVCAKPVEVLVWPNALEANVNEAVKAEVTLISSISWKLLIALAGNPSWPPVTVPNVLKYQRHQSYRGLVGSKTDLIYAGILCLPLLFKPYLLSHWILFTYFYSVPSSTQILDGKKKNSCRPSLKFSLLSSASPQEIAGMGRVEAAHVTLFPSVTFVFYLAIRSFPTLGLTVIRETS